MPKILRDTVERFKQTPGELKDLYTAPKEQKLEKRSAIVRANFELLNEWGNALGWIPVIGDYLKSEIQRGENAIILFWGINENGELIPPDKKAAELLKGYTQEVKHRFGAALDAFLIFGGPEMLLGKIAGSAAKAGKLAKAAKVVETGYKGWKFYNSIDEIFRELRRIHTEGKVDFKTAVIAAPYLLGLFKGQPGGEHLDKLATAIDRTDDAGKNKIAQFFQDAFDALRGTISPEEDRQRATQLYKLQQEAQPMPA